MLTFTLARLGMTHADLDAAITWFRGELWREAADLFPLEDA